MAALLLLLIYPLRELPMVYLVRGSCRLSICFPAALRSTGITPFHHYYGGSDSCVVWFCHVLSTQASCVHAESFLKHTVTNHRYNLLILDHG